MTPEDRRIRATEARQLLEHPMLVEAFTAVERHLSQSALMCDMEDASKSQRIVMSLQLLAAVKREIQRIVQDGVVAEVQINELDQKRSLMKRVLNR